MRAHDVDCAETLHADSNGAAAVVTARDIADERDAALAELRDLALEFLAVHIEGDNAGPLVEEPAHDAEADPLRRAGDHHAHAREAAHEEPLREQMRELDE